MHGLILDLDACPSIDSSPAPLPAALAHEPDNRLQLAATAFEHSTAAVMITDTHQRILAVNAAFSIITGYSEQQALNQTPRLLASGQHDSAFFAAMWHKLNAEGQWQGEICNRRQNGDTYPSWLSINTQRDADGTISHFIAVFADISDLKRSAARLDHQAHHDPLTGLPNRTLFENRLSSALQHSQDSASLGAVLFIDLDRFKPVNDTLGHAVGDLLLKSLAQRLKDNLRDIDTVARLGGDEFVVLLPGLLQASDAQSIASKLLTSLQTPLPAGEHQLVIGASIGISLFPDDGLDSATLLKNADAAMYRAKAKGRNCVERYSHDLSVRRRERIALEQQLQQAIDNHQLSLSFQPRISLPDQRLSGAAVQLRWNHPQLGLLTPEHFMPLAEASGSSRQIGEWLMETACRQLQHWQKQQPGFGPLAISLTSAQLRQPQLPERMLQLLSAFRLKPASLQLEITEQSIMNQPEHTLSVLHSLKRLGIRLAIDDFGTGHSSLGYLKRLPLDALKIDRSFIRSLPEDRHDTAIVRAIIALGHSLQLTVIAEGIETPEQRRVLEAEGCRQLQGPLIGAPLAAEDFQEKCVVTRFLENADGAARQAPL
ncbi:sensory box/GGDEF domain/EAL domain-containing protein [Pseudomonas sp. StFLB209]|nr:sensory box/GGDEF domain/EAL domain-containing protein [Pseudomonas sp. StFLB209]